VGSRALAAVLAVALGLSRASAQVQAPTLVEGELPAEAARPAARPGEPVPEPPPAPEPVAPPRAAAPAAPPVPAAPTEPGVTIGAEELRRIQRAIEPVRISPERIGELWQARRRALREQDAAGARAAAQGLRAAQRELGIVNLPAHAAVEVRDAERSLRARATEDALEHAQLAVELAPDLHEPLLALARARLAADPARPGPAASAALEGLRTAARDPRVVRPLLGDLAAAALAALFAAAAATVAVLFLSRVRLFLHDVRHLPLVRAGTSGQATLLALALLALPVVFRLGAFPVLLAAALAAWPYLARRERVATAVALLLLVALPWLALEGARAATWQGTLADEVHQIDQGDPPPARVAALEARAAREALPPPALLALGRWHKRRGDLDAARRRYEEALAADPRSADARVDLGNVLFLQGDLDGAKAAYLAAADAGPDLPTLAAAHYDLSKLYLRVAAVGQSSEARRRAQQEDPAYLARHGSDEDFLANTWLVDAIPSTERIAALARTDPGAQEVSDRVRRFLAGPLPARAWPAVPLACVALLALLSLVARRLAPSRPCDRCGRPACPRCDGATTDACGQCVNVFFQQNAVDPRDRIRKEVQVRRHARVRTAVTRALAILGGGAGQVLAGAAPLGLASLAALVFLGALALFWQGTLPGPPPTPWAVGLRLGVTVPAFLLLYALVVRDVFRRSAGRD
jgi:tetratricopeptide (TPR) repeat protein